MRVPLTIADQLERAALVYPDRVGIRSVLRSIKTDLYMTLGGEIIYLVRLNHLNDTNETACIGHVSEMNNEIRIRDRLDEMINTICVD